LSEDGSLIVRESRPDSLVELTRCDDVFEVGWVETREKDSVEWDDEVFLSVVDGESKSVEREDGVV